LALTAAIALTAAEDARGGGMLVTGPDPLEASDCMTGGPAEFIGYGAPVVMGCVTLRDGSVVQLSDSEAGYHCLHVVAAGTTDGGMCGTPAKSEVFGDPPRLLGRPQIHVGPRLSGSVPRWNSLAGQRRFVSGLASPEAGEIVVRFRLRGQDGTTSTPAATLALNEEQLRRLDAPRQALLYVAEIPPGRASCGGAVVQASATDGAVDVRKVGRTEIPCELRQETATSGGVDLMSGLREMLVGLGRLLGRLV
jgi:hypothetical protein